MNMMKHWQKNELTKNEHWSAAKKYKREIVIQTESYETLEIISGMTENNSCAAHLLTNGKNQEFIFLA